MHHGMVYVGLPYSCPELADISEVKGGSPWGAATIAGADGSRYSVPPLVRSPENGSTATSTMVYLRWMRMNSDLAANRSSF